MTKHIGIVDVTTVGASICARAIVEKAAEHDVSGEHPEFTMHSFSFKLYKELVLAQDWKGMAELILKSIEKLKLVGADFVIIPSNTPHYAFAEIESSSPLPVLNLIDLVAQECADKGFKKVAVLGTKATMEGSLYKSPLEERSITPVIPGATLRDEINALIMDEIIPGKVEAATLAKVRDKLKLLDCDAYILGCTELPEVYSSEVLGKPCIDTTRLLGYRALELANTPEKELKMGSSHSYFGMRK